MDDAVNDLICQITIFDGARSSSEALQARRPVAASAILP
jgi:hypothetical protein